MARHKLLAAGAAVLVLVAVFLAAGRGADEKELRAAMDKLVKTAADKPDDLRKEGAGVAKAHKIDNDAIKEVMDLLSRRDPTSPGWGVGKPGTIKPDGIEPKLREMVKLKPMSKEQLDKEADALTELANRTAAVGSVALAAPPTKNVPGKDPKDWREYTDEMIKSSRDLAKAVKDRNPAAVKDAAGKLNGSCSSCHGKFRD